MSKAMPKYREIAADMVARLNSDEWPAGRGIPSIDDLEGMYDASRMTIYKSVQYLQGLGYLAARHGSGTIACTDSPIRRMGILIGDDIFASPPPFYAAALVRCLRDWLKTQSMNAKVYVVEDYDRSAPYPNTELTRDAEHGALRGLFVLGTGKLPALFADAAERGLPTVDMGAHIHLPQHVGPDFDDILRTGMRHLRERGCRSVGLVSGSDISTRFHEEVVAAGLSTRPDWLSCPWPDRSREIGNAHTLALHEGYGFDEALRILSRPPRPDALLVPDDRGCLMS
jgi:DNA-binding LacI/PurR family transcriptional regulator